MLLCVCVREREREREERERARTHVEQRTCETARVHDFGGDGVPALHQMVGVDRVADIIVHVVHSLQHEVLLPLLQQPAVE